ncbi:MAG: YaaL family protein [Thermoanaerobacteraceae bacterium]|nr:YaaL family protein [Thermoanaerobacteraceae bacterium]
MVFFRKKGLLRKEFDEKLLKQISDAREKRMRQKMFLQKVFEPSDELINEARITEAKYFFLIKEAKNRNLSMK